MANWFIGIPVPAGAWFARVCDPPAGVRLFHPDDLHLTVAFLGAVSAQAALAAFAAIQPFPLAPLEVTLGAVVAMGAARRPSALSARVVQGEQALARAITAVRDTACDHAGAARELRPALPHLTVARPRRAANDIERAAALRWASALELGAPRIPLTQVALYTWSLRRESRLFTRSCEVDLA